MRDASFHLDEAAAEQAQPPFNFMFVDRPWPRLGWSVREGSNREVGGARTRAGARAAVIALYAAKG